ncbi:hypothetical protein ACFONC_03090 [Luteimonas soli]|uniref:DUF2267 domain-containing protein n=1 Tax=Luteimonas soli TaxID=1648966 RepID=A0ABV7XG60_9GAMM
MTTETEVQKRIAAILDDAARGRGSDYAIATCRAAIDKLWQDGHITAEHREALLLHVGNLLVKWTPELVKNYLANTERELAMGALSQVELQELGTVLLQLVGEQLVTVEEALALQTRALVAPLAVPPAEPAPIIGRIGPRSTT